MIHNRTNAILAILFTLTALAPAVFASDEGTITIEQKNTQYMGSWGLGSATGVMEGEDKLFTAKKPAGAYLLTVTPPAGAVPTVEVYEDGTLEKTFDTRTANGRLGSGGTLRFVITYAFTRVGTVGVSSAPDGIDFEMKGPLKNYKGTTPASFENVPEGTYTVYYKPAKPCIIPRPIARSLKSGGRIGFSTDFSCVKPSGKDHTGKKPPATDNKGGEKPATTPPKKIARNPVRVILSNLSTEAAAGGITRSSIVVLNHSDKTLSDLSVDYRYDGSRLSVRGTVGAELQPNRVTWSVPSLAPGTKWKQEFNLRIDDDVPSGAMLISSVTVNGDDLGNIAVRNRSSSARIGVIAALPETGIGMPLDIILSAVLFAIVIATLGIGGAVRAVR